MKACLTVVCSTKLAAEIAWEGKHQNLHSDFIQTETSVEA